MIQTMNVKKENIPSIGQYEKLKAWGLYSSVDVFNCDPEYIKNDELIRQYILQLCDILRLERSGEISVVDLNNEYQYPCYSMTKLDKSLVTVHFSEKSNTAYVDVFSSKYYDPEVVAHFSICFFKGKNYDLNVIVRQ